MLRCSRVVEPGSVTAGGSVTITWRAVDAAGVHWTSAWVTPPGGQSTLQCGLAAMTRGRWWTVGGPRRVRSWKRRPTAPTACGSAPATWWVTSGAQYDARPRCTTPPSPSSAGSNDVDAPVVYEVVVEPGSVTAGGSVTITWRAVDAAGVQWTSAWVTLPGGQSILQCSLPTMTDGTVVDGRWSQTCPILEAAPNGTYSVWISASDVVGNQRRSNTTHGLGVRRHLHRPGGSNDVDAPVVSEVVVEPGSVTAGGSVTITWRAVDAAGVQWTSAWVTPPGGQSILQCSLPTMTDGTVLDGRWSNVSDPGCGALTAPTACGSAPATWWATSGGSHTRHGLGVRRHLHRHEIGGRALIG